MLIFILLMELFMFLSIEKKTLFMVVFTTFYDECLVLIKILIIVT